MRFRGPQAQTDTRDSPKIAVVGSKTPSYWLGIPLLLTEEFELVIMIESVTEEMHGSDW